MKNIDEMQIGELYDIQESIENRIKILLFQDCLESLIKRKDEFKGYRYFLLEEDGYHTFAFSSFSKGYIDDHIPEEKEQLIYDILAVIPHNGECNSCTYGIDEENIPEIESLMHRLGIPQDEPAW